MESRLRRLSSTLRWLPLAALLISGVAGAQTLDDWKTPARAAQKKNPLTPDAECIAVGKDLYVHECASCHGDSGRGDGPAAKNLDPKPHDFAAASVAAQTDGALFWKIGEGHRPMPSFRLLVSEDGRWHVVTYLRTLAPPPATQPVTQPATRSGG